MIVRFSNSFRPLLFGLAALVGLAVPALADPGFKNVTFSAVKDGPTVSVFPPDASAIFMRAEMADVPPDAKMTCAWIATQAVGAPQNFVIDSADQVAGTVFGLRMNVLSCSLGKPNAGFPMGSYRVELSVDGKKTNEAAFEVKSAAAPAAPAPAAAAPAAAAPAAAAPAPSAVVEAARQNFTIVNRTGYDISEIYVSPAKGKKWGEDLLGDDELDDEGEQLIPLGRAAEKTCVWDLKVVYSADDSEAVWYDIDLCKFSKVTIKYNRKSDKTSATFD